MTAVVRVQVHDLDLDDGAVVDRLEAFDNATFDRVDGLSHVTVYVEDGQSVVDTVLETTRRLANTVAGAKAVRVDPDLVTISDIAARVGVSREAVRLWTRGTRKPFPIQFDTIGADQRVWRWVEVVEWLEWAKAIDMDEDLPTVADIEHINACLQRVPDVWEPAGMAEVVRHEGWHFHASGASLVAHGRVEVLAHPASVTSFTWGGVRVS